MLERENRITRSDEFAQVVKRGRRAGSKSLVVYVGPQAAPESAVAAGSTAGPRAGLIVGRGVGNSVTRNRVKRRLRHLLAAHLEGLGTDLIVVRALAGAGASTSGELEKELVPLLDRARGRR